MEQKIKEVVRQLAELAHYVRPNGADMWTTCVHVVCNPPNHKVVGEVLDHLEGLVEKATALDALITVAKLQLVVMSAECPQFAGGGWSQVRIDEAHHWIKFAEELIQRAWGEHKVGHGRTYYIR